MLRLRTLEERDLEKMLAWENDSTAWQSSDNIAPLSHRMALDYILTYDADPFRAGQIRLVAEYDNETIGLLDLFDISALHRHAFVGIYIDADYRHKGLGSKCLHQLCEYAFKHLRLHTLAACILPTNIISVSLFCHAGFVHSGTLPGWHSFGNNFNDIYLFCKSAEAPAAVDE